MKKALAVLLTLCTLFSLCSCGAEAVVGQANDMLAARRVDDMIAELGDTVTLESEEAIIAVEEAYNALTDEQKARVEYAEYLPVYRNNLDILKQEARQKADLEALTARMIGRWVNLYDPEDGGIVIREDGTATISGFEYEWRLNQNLETIRFEGAGSIVLAVEDHEGLLALNNPEIMICMKQEDYEPFAIEAIKTVDFNVEPFESYFGEAMDLGPLVDANGKETGAHMFAFHSKAYDNGLIFFYSGMDFAIDYKGSGRVHGAIYEPYGASFITDAKQIPVIKITAVNSTITYIRAEYVADLCYDSESRERVITLTNGIELRTSSAMNPAYMDVSFNVYDYLADPNYVF